MEGAVDPVVAGAKDEPVITDGKPGRLILEDVLLDARHPHRVVATVLFGGHRGRLELDFSRREMGLVEHRAVPPLLGHEPASMRMVVEVLERFLQGESLDFPLDLSAARERAGGSVFAASARDREALDRAADEVSLEVVALRWNEPRPGQVTADVLLAGEPLTVVAEVEPGLEQMPVTRWLEAPLETLTRVEQYAIHRLLHRAAKR